MHIDNLEPRKTSKRHQHVQESIMRVVRSQRQGTHLNAVQIWNAAKEQGLKISLASVYRALNLLEANGSLMAIASDSGRRYEAHDGEHEHDHLLCVKCGLTIEFADDLIRGFGKTVALKNGYEYAGSRFDILGICAECRDDDPFLRLAQLNKNLQSLDTQISQISKDLGAVLEFIEKRKVGSANEAMTRMISQCANLLSEMDECGRVLSRENSRRPES